MSDSTTSVENVKETTRKVALAYAGCLVSVYETATGARESVSARLTEQQATAKPVIADLVARGEKLQAQGKARLEDIKVPGVLTQPLDKIKAKFATQ